MTGSHADLRWCGFQAPSGQIELSVPHEWDVIGDALLTGTYGLPPPLLLALGMVEHGGTLLDLGAHLGTLAVPAAAQGCRVLAVDASRTNVICLEASAARSGLDDLEVVHAAVIDREADVAFVEAGAWGQVVDDAGQQGARTVRGRSADAIVESFGLRTVDVVKVDVEGSETEAFIGMRRLLTGPSPPSVVFESNRVALNERGLEPSDLLAQVAAFGFDLYWIGPYEVAPVDPGVFQPETVADYLAVRGPLRLPTGWRLRPRRSAEELAEAAHTEASFPNRVHRASTGHALCLADETVRSRDAAQRAFALLRIDPDAHVVASVADWPAKHVVGAGQGGRLLEVASRLRVLRHLGRALGHRTALCRSAFRVVSPR